MDKRDFNLKAFNDSFSAAIKDKELNFGKMLVQAYDEDLSVTGKYEPPKERVVLDERLAPVIVKKEDGEEPFYYGVSPLFDTKTVMGLLSGAELLSEDALDGCIRENREWFMLHAGQGEYLLPMARYIMLSVAAHFGLRIAAPKSVYTAVCEKLGNSGLSKAAAASMLLYNDQTGVLTLRGFITRELFEAMDAYSYAAAEPPAEGEEARSELVIAENGGYGLKEAYASHVVLVRGRVFYSGTMLRPRRIDILEGSNENFRIRSILIAFERTTYAACCALDGNLTEHPLLAGCKAKIVELLKTDDALKQKLKRDIESLPSPDNANAGCMLAAVNDYLKETFNINQIGVSGNIVSENGYMMLGMRSSGSIDSGKLYPGVNGNAEIADPNVSFYGLSVYEDYPTVKVDADRIDFFGEIGREAYAELHQDLTKQEWICYGLIVSGNMPRGNSGEGEYTEPFRRLHFNLIFEHDCKKSRAEIERSAQIAAEAFETKNFLGVAVSCERNRAAYLWKAFKRGITTVVNQQDFIESLLAIVVFLPAVGKFISALKAHESVGTALKSLFSEGWTGTAAIVLAAVVVGWTLIRVIRLGIRSFAALNKVRHIRIYRSTPYTAVDGILRRKLRMRAGRYLLLNVPRFFARLHGKRSAPTERAYDYHPAAFACLRAYIDNKAHDTFYLKDRR